MTALALTGVTGFVGAALLREALRRGHPVRAIVRRPVDLGLRDPGLEVRVVPDPWPRADWARVLEGIGAVVHLAARVHVMRENSPDPEAAYHAANVAPTIAIGQGAVAAGVPRLVYVSTIKVNGEQTRDRPFRAEDPPNAVGPYARSKLAAEDALRGMSGSLTGVVIRPPLIYGAGMRGNMQRLFDLVDRGVPLPLARVENARSLIGLGNLVDVLLLAAVHQSARGIFLVADGEDLSTPALIRRIAMVLGRPDRLFPIPAGWLRGGARLLGRGAAADRLLGSLQVDIGPLRQALGWQPPCTVQDGLLECARWYRARAAARA